MKHMCVLAAASGQDCSISAAGRVINSTCSAPQQHPTETVGIIDVVSNHNESNRQWHSRTTLWERMLDVSRNRACANSKRRMRKSDLLLGQDARRDNSCSTLVFNERFAEPVWGRASCQTLFQQQNFTRLGTGGSRRFLMAVSRTQK